MKAVVKAGPVPGIEVAEVQAPEPKPGEVLIKVESASVCGTDYGIVAWHPSAAIWNPAFPFTMGHEYCGEIVALGDGVEGLKVGDRIAGESHVSCGQCAACKLDRRHNCLNMIIPGVNRNGAFAELLAVPASACFVLPEGVGREAVLFEAAGVAIHAIQQAGDVAGRTAVVTGAGPVGLFLIAALNALGAERVAVLEPSESRRRRAEAEGATGFAADQVDDLVAFVRETGSIRGADIGFEVSGAPVAYQTQFQALGLESTLVSVGHPATEVSVNVAKEVNLRVINWKGVFGRRIWSSWDLLSELVTSGKLNLASFIEEEVSAYDLPEQIWDLKELPGKVLVRP